MTEKLEEKKEPMDFLELHYDYLEKMGNKGGVINVDNVTIKIWLWCYAPQELRKKCNHGGDEEHLIQIKGKHTDMSFLVLKLLLNFLDGSWGSIHEINQNINLYSTAH